MFRAEFYRAFRNRVLWLALSLGVLALAYDLSEYGSGPSPNEIPGASPFLNNAYDAFIWAENGLFALLAPLIAVLPFADSYAFDRAQGYLNFVLLRSSYRRYLVARFLTNLLAGGLAILLPLLALFAYTNIVYPRGFPPLDEARIPFDPLPGPLGHLYRQAPDGYILFLLGLGFAFGASYATLGLAISALVTHRYVVLATPFLLYQVANFVLAVLQLERWSPPVALLPHTINTTSWLTVFGQLGGILVLSLTFIVVLARRERLYA